MKTYPVPAHKGAEVSCTAGITDDGKWVRLFPVPYRFLNDDQRFSKYQWISADLKKASDFRPESFHPRVDTIAVEAKVGPKDRWKDRKAIVFPLRAHCLCCLQKARDESGEPTLGFFKPKVIRRLVIEKEKELAWNASQLAALNQGNLFQSAPTTDLEKLPFKFSYSFVCDESECTGHTLSCTDWEIGQAYRNWRAQYGDGWEEKFRNRFEHEMIHLNDTHFYVGTVHQHPASWIIVGLFYPRILPQ